MRIDKLKNLGIRLSPLDALTAAVELGKTIAAGKKERAEYKNLRLENRLAFDEDLDNFKADFVMAKANAKLNRDCNNYVNEMRNRGVSEATIEAFLENARRG